MAASLLTLCALGTVLVQDPATARPAALTRFLQQEIGLDMAQLAAIERGEGVVRVLPTQDRRDVAVFGIITAAVARDVYVRRMRDFRTSLRTPDRTRLGIFGDPATEADVADVTIHARDIQEMKTCRPGRCGVKLPATDMQRIREEMNWSAPDLEAQVTAYARRRLLQYVADYRARGDSALVIYDDRDHGSVYASEAFAAQLAESPYVYQNVPSLYTYLTTYPRGALRGATEVIFWSEDVVPRLRPILSVTHLVVYAPAELPAVTVVAAKQIYANHYFETTLDLTLAVDRQVANQAPGTYLLVLRRYRFDHLPGGILNIRGRAIAALRDRLASDLRREAAVDAAR